jgi:hypothetical protein
VVGALVADEALPESPKLGGARRSTGWSSLLGVGVLAELFPVSPELDGARRSTGWSVLLLFDELPDEELPDDEPPDDELIDNGRDKSSVATDAAECSSGLSSRTIVMVTA